MKKLTIILFLLILALVIDHTYAQILAKAGSRKEQRIEKKKTVVSRVNDASLKSFTKDFGDISNVTWVKMDDYDEAVFTKEGHTMNAYYDANGELIGTTTLKTFGDLPLVGQQNLKVLFWNYSILQVIYYQSNPSNKELLKLWKTDITDPDTYLVEMNYGFRRLVLYVDHQGKVSLFKRLG